MFQPMNTYRYKCSPLSFIACSVNNNMLSMRGNMVGEKSSMFKGRNRTVFNSLLGTEIFCTVCQSSLKRVIFDRQVCEPGMGVEEICVCKNGHVFSYESLDYLKSLHGLDWK